MAITWNRSISDTKRWRDLCVAVLLLCTAGPSCASDEITFGIGLGAMYSGLGMNIALRSEHDLRYLSAGCVALGYSDAEGRIAACGVGAGWLWTNNFSDSNNRHGLGLSLGPIGYRGRTYVGEEGDTIYGAGISYAYFVPGISRKGWNLGATLAVGHKDDANGHLLLQAGYQY